MVFICSLFLFNRTPILVHPVHLFSNTTSGRKELPSLYPLEQVVRQRLDVVRQWLDGCATQQTKWHMCWFWVAVDFQEGPVATARECMVPVNSQQHVQWG